MLIVRVGFCNAAAKAR